MTALQPKSPLLYCRSGNRWEQDAAEVARYNFRKGSNPSSSPCSAASPDKRCIKAAVESLHNPLLGDVVRARLHDTFANFDIDHSGALTRPEIKKVFSALGDHVSEEELDYLFHKLDLNNTESLDFDEFLHLAAEVLSLKQQPDNIEDVALSKLEARIFRAKLGISLVLLVGYWMVGLAYGMTRQDWGIIDSMYFVVATFTTVGYGDYSFKGTWKDKIFGGIYVFVGVAVIGAAAGIILDSISQHIETQMTKLRKDQEQQTAADGTSHFDVRREIWARYMQSGKHICNIAVVLFVGAVAMTYIEGWELADAFYWCSVTMTTVGYGDISARTEGGKLFSILFMLIAFGIIASAISFLASLPFEVRKLRYIANILQQFGESMDSKELRGITRSNEVQTLRTDHQNQAHTDLYVMRAEFVIWQLLKQDKIKMDQDVKPCLSIFDELDVDGSGIIDETDIQKHVHNKLLGNSLDQHRSM